VTEKPIWLLLSNTSPGRGPETYGDFENIYAWTNRVPNARQISEGNVAIIGDNYAERQVRFDEKAIQHPGNVASVSTNTPNHSRI
jgi:hypothetical protein